MSIYYRDSPTRIAAAGRWVARSLEGSRFAQRVRNESLLPDVHTKRQRLWRIVDRSREPPAAYPQSATLQSGSLQAVGCRRRI